DPVTVPARERRWPGHVVTGQRVSKLLGGGDRGQLIEPELRARPQRGVEVAGVERGVRVGAEGGAPVVLAGQLELALEAQRRVAGLHAQRAADERGDHAHRVVATRVEVELA